MRDVEDLLPTPPASSTLSSSDEASQIYHRRAGSLLRARCAVVVGDARQLRHVSFVSDAMVARAVDDHGLGSLASRLDVRRASVLDVASGAAPVTWLDEHHRSVPHLIDFSARRFYEGRLVVATRHPANEVVDAIDVVRVAPSGDEPGATGGDRRRAGRGGAPRRQGLHYIAVVSPFRKRAESPSDLLTSYDLDDVERLAAGGTVQPSRRRPTRGAYARLAPDATADGVASLRPAPVTSWSPRAKRSMVSSPCWHRRTPTRPPARRAVPAHAAPAGGPRRRAPVVPWATAVHARTAAGVTLRPATRRR